MSPVVTGSSGLGCRLEEANPSPAVDRTLLEPFLPVLNLDQS